jgi:hypothetical protein
MVPTAPFALFVLLALVPGWLYFRMAESRGPRPERSQLAEFLELTAVGFTAITIAAISVIALSLRFHWLFDLVAWARVRHSYLGAHFAAALASVGLGIALSCLIVTGMFLGFYGRKAASFLPGANVWDKSLGPAPDGMQNWLAVHRPDGSIVEGLLLSYPSGAGENAREIALTKPIFITSTPGSNRYKPDIDRVVIPGDQIVAISVKHVPKPAATRPAISPSSSSLPNPGEGPPGLRSA